MMKAANELYPGISATAVARVSYSGSSSNYYLPEGERDEYYDGDTKPLEFDKGAQETLLDNLQAFDSSSKVSMYASNHTYATYDDIISDEAQALFGGTDYQNLTIVSLDRETYLSIINKAGAKDGQAVVLNYLTYRNSEGVRTILRPFKFTKGILNIVSNYDEKQLDIGGQITDCPPELRLNMRGILYIFTQDFAASELDFYAETPDSAGFVKHAKNSVSALYPNDEDIYLRSEDIKGQIAATKGLSTLIMVFIYGFVAMLTLIGLTNVISTISTNTRLRRREFAALVSVGMSHGGIKRMISYEGLLCGLRSLVFGLIIGLGLSYVIHNQIINVVDYPYVFPTVPVIAAVIAVFAVTIVTMRFSAAKLQKSSLVDAMRGLD
jgi:putative ABC transport system permease protein